MAKFTNESAFTLIEVLIAMAVSSVVMFSIMQMTQNSNKAVQSVKANSEINDFVNLLQLQLATNCNSIAAVNGNQVNPQNQGVTTVRLTA